jgi:Integral membrane protein TerC family
VLLAALGVFGTGTGWPDIVVAATMAVLALQGASTVLRCHLSNYVSRSRQRHKPPSALPSDEPADLVSRGENHVGAVPHHSGWHEGGRPLLRTVLADIGLEAQISKAILIGIGAATALRIVFAGITTQLLRLVGLLLAGGLLLLWVCWKMRRELRAPVEQGQEAPEALTGYDINANGTIPHTSLAKLSSKLPGRSSSLTYRCRSTMFYPDGPPPMIATWVRIASCITDLTEDVLLARMLLSAEAINQKAIGLVQNITTAKFVSWTYSIVQTIVLSGSALLIDR